MRLHFLIGFFFLLATVNLSANTPTTTSSQKILFIVSNAHFYGDTKMNTANHFAEIVFPYDKLVKAGYTVDFVSPEGGAIPIGYIQTSTPIIKEYLYDKAFMKLLKNTKKPSEINAADYLAVYYGGGGAAMFGVPENQAIQKIAMSVYEEQAGIVAAVCHGSAGLVNLKKKDGSYLVAGKKVNGFPDLFEDMKATYYQTFPFSIEKKLAERGGNFQYSKEGWDGFAIEDGRLITGQDPSAAVLVAEKMIAQLQKKRTLDPTTEKKLDKFYTEWSDPNKPGVVGGVIKDGEVIYLKAYGAADMEQQLPNTINTQFQIGNLSMQFTAFAILLLEEEGKLSLSDDVRKYLPELPDFGHTITLKHLISQSSGLHEYEGLQEIAGWGPNEVVTNREIINLISQQKELDYVPGTEFSLTRTGFILLAEVIEKVTGQSIADYTKTHIFEPLQMNNTQFCDDHDALIPNSAKSYQATDNGFKQRKVTNGTVGTHNVYISAADLAKWYLNFEKPKVGSTALMKKLRSPVTSNSGETYNSLSGELHYGQHFYHLERGTPAYWNYGLAGGYASNIFTFPEQNLTTFVLGNNNRYNGMPAMSMAYELIKDVFPEPPSIDFAALKTVKLSTKELAQYEGYYWDENSALARRIYNKNDTLRYARLASNRESMLVPLSKNKFQMVVGSDDVYIIEFKERNGQKIMKFTGGESNPYPFVYDKYTPVTHDSQSLAQYTGRFYCAALNTTYTFSVKDNQLIASHLRKRDISFIPVKNDLFTGSTWYFGGIKFERNNQQTVTGFEINFDGIKNLRFEKAVTIGEESHGD